MSNIGFIGIGKLGLECAEACAEKGHSVFGYDIEKKPVRKVIQQQTIKETKLIEFFLKENSKSN